ncbi:unnamed protein product [Ixodes pacificus]
MRRGISKRLAEYADFPWQGYLGLLPFWHSYLSMSL